MNKFLDAVREKHGKAMKLGFHIGTTKGLVFKDGFWQEQDRTNPACSHIETLLLGEEDLSGCFDADVVAVLSRLMYEENNNGH